MSKANVSHTPARAIIAPYPFSLKFEYFCFFQKHYKSAILPLLHIDMLDTLIVERVVRMPISRWILPVCECTTVVAED